MLQKSFGRVFLEK